MLGSSLSIQAQTSDTGRSFLFKGIVIERSGQPIINFAVAISPQAHSSISKNEFTFRGKGSFQISLRIDGFSTIQRSIHLSSDTTVVFNMDEDTDTINIERVSVLGKQWKNTVKMRETVNSLDRTTIEKMPSFLGEKDVIRSLQFMPGVSFGNEGNAELSVRGGTSDQNLTMIDGMPLYNSTHLFGMYSAFNPLVIGGVKLYTGGFPASFGGKVSSVVDVTTRNADFRKSSGSIELGLTSLKGHMELPLIKEKLTLLMAARRSFFETLTLINQSSNKEYFNFYDLNGILTYLPDSSTVFKLSTYMEGDQFRYVTSGIDKERNGLRKGQRAISLNWNRIWNRKLSTNLTSIFSRYSNVLFEEHVRQQAESSYSNSFRSTISTAGIKAVLSYAPNNTVQLTGGLENNTHFTDPSAFYGTNNGKPFSDRTLSKSVINDFSTFTQITLNSKYINLDVGARSTLVTNADFTSHVIEPRVSIFQNIGKSTALKFTYSRMSQPVQRLQNPGLGMPMEIIFPSDRSISPQISDIVTVSIAKDFQFSENKRISFAVEAYQKKSKNILSFKDGFDTRSVIYYAFGGVYRANSVHEMILSEGLGRAKGIDFKIDGSFGNVSGWISYSLSQSENRFGELNQGYWFDAPHDRRHIFNTAVSWMFSKKWHLNLSWNYSSGQPITLPISYYPLYTPYPDGNLVGSAEYLYHYGPRNGYRMIPFHKLDIGFTKKTTAFGMDADLNFGVYNLYNRKNPSFYYLGKERQEGALPEIRSLSVFPIMPSISLKVNIENNNTL
ncbi:MAG: TonB-dependent receptor plug domain-containing protein [Sphingobacterium sp.]